MLEPVVINARMVGRDGHVQHNTRRNPRERYAAPVKSHTIKDFRQQCQISSENARGMARRGQDPNLITRLPRRRHLRLVRIEKFRMTKTAGLKGVPKNPQNPSHNLRRRLCKDSAEPKPQPAPKTRRRLGGAQERNPSRRLGEDSNIWMVSEFISSFLLRTS